MSAYIVCPRCHEDTLDVDTLKCDCGYSASNAHPPPPWKYELLEVSPKHDRAGARCVRIGPDVFLGQFWTPIRFDGEDDPDWMKTSSLQSVTRPPWPEQCAACGRLSVEGPFCFKCGHDKREEQ